MSQDEIVEVEVLKDGRWSQSPSLPQLEVKKGEKVNISAYLACLLESVNKCKILKPKKPKAEKSTKVAKQVKRKSEANPAEMDKKAAEGSDD